MSADEAEQMRVHAKPPTDMRAVWRANGGTDATRCQPQTHEAASSFLRGQLCHIDEEQTFDIVCCRGPWQPAVVRCDRQ